MMVLSRWSTLLVAMLMLLVVAALWLPFGFILPHHEPWLLHAQYQAGILPTVSLTEVRSMHFIVPYVAYLLSPENFLGYHALQILGFWAKGFLLYLILRTLLPQYQRLALLAGVLLIIYPADDANFIQQATLHHISLALLLLSVYLFLVFRERRNWLLFAVMIVCQWASISIYEAGLPLMFFVPLLVLWLERKLNRRAVLLAAGWMIVPLFWTAVLALYFLNPTPVTAQSYVMRAAQPEDGNANMLSSAITSLRMVYEHHFYQPWQQTLNFLNLGYIPATYPRIAAVMALGIALVLLALRNKVTGSGWRTLLVVIVAGIVLTGVGFVMYLPTSLKMTTVRTFFFTAIGAATALAALVTLVSHLLRGRAQGIAFSLLAACILFVAFTQILLQYSQLSNASTRLQTFLTNIVRAAPNLDDDTMLLIYGDETVDAPVEVPITKIYEGFAFSYLYEDYSVVLSNGSHFLKGCIYTVNPDPTQRVSCVPTDDGILVTEPRGEFTVPYSRIVVVQMDETGEVTLLEQLPATFADAEALAEYQPFEHIDPEAPYPPHAQSVLGM